MTKPDKLVDVLLRAVLIPQLPAQAQQRFVHINEVEDVTVTDTRFLCQLPPLYKRSQEVP